MKSLIVLAILLPAALASTFGVDVSTRCGVNAWKCLHGKGHRFAIPRAWYSFGAPDPIAVHTIREAKAGGMAHVDVYMFPCRGKSADSQAAGLVNYLRRSLEEEEEVVGEAPLQEAFDPETEDFMAWRERHVLKRSYGMVWLDIENNVSRGCSWKIGNQASNCHYIQELANSLQRRGQSVGIYSSVGEWEMVLGSRHACPQLAHLPLWYAHYDNRATFRDFGGIGGWSRPAMKQFHGTTYECGCGIDKNFYP